MPTSYGHRSALHILKTISQRGWAPVRDYTAATRKVPEVRIRYAPNYSHETEYNPDSLVLFVNGTNDSVLLYPDEWDDAVLLHEYAHHLAKVDSFRVDGPFNSGYHVQWGSSDTDSLAWKEGWADFYGAFRGGDTSYPGYGTYSDYGRGAGGTVTRLFMDLESDTVTLFAPNLSTVSRDSTLFGRGDRWEGSIAAALWDLYDSQNDRVKPTALGDSLSEGFSNIWACLTPSPSIKVGDVHRFLTEFESRYANPNVDFRKTTLLRRIFLDHGIYAGRDSFAISGVDGAALNTGPPVRLMGASPNPLNPRSRIRFVVRDEKLPGKVSLRIFSVQGRLVRVLQPGQVVPGVNDVVWDGTSDASIPVASGVYFCELRCGQVRDRARLVVLR